ncbi:hypothetical protein [Parabacteroides sp. PF5-9]|uniref:hypothetical protein n=1 Tax=Parabacteroides sp. PF5-9 TaxID=1742404 RepID=UPI0024767F79|nr:hypothetical protein [Parabacteroides sp. PF5-9]MDH6357242.1 hypothetical protein [Parabacteroides sp. PF5-9]
MSKIELEASEALLDVGVSLPFKEIKIPFTRKRIKLRLTMRRPCLGNQIRIARQYLKLGVTLKQMEAFTKEEEMEFMAKHGGRICNMIALTICRGYINGWLFSPFMSFFVRWFVPDAFIQGANLRFITLMGTRNFMNIIKSAERTNPLRPKLSQQKKGS